MRVRKWVNYFFKYVYMPSYSQATVGFWVVKLKWNMTQCVIEYLKD